MSEPIWVDEATYNAIWGECDYKNFPADPNVGVISVGTDPELKTTAGNDLFIGKRVLLIKE